MGDIDSFRGMSKEIIDFRSMFGEDPLWTNSMFGGMPAFQITVNYSLNLINYLYKFLLGFPRPAEFLFLYALGFYILLRTLKVEYRISIVGSLAFALSSYLIIIIMAGHSSKAYAIAFMAPVLAGFILTYRGQVLRGIALTGIAMALELRANHIQVTYYLGILILFYVVAEFIRSYKRNSLSLFVKRSVAIGAILIVALLTNSGNIYNTYVYGKYSTRGPSELTINPDGSSNEESNTGGLDPAYVTDWSYGIEETLTFIIPNAKGGATSAISSDPDALKGVDAQMRQFVGGNNHYWGNQRFTSGPVYLGIIIVFLFFLGMASIKSRFKWVILGLGFLAMFLSWGKNMMWLTSFFLDYIPLYNKFRAVTIILVIIELITPLLAILYLNRAFITPSVLNEKFTFKGNEYGTKFYIISGGMAIVLFALYIFPNTFLEFFSISEMNNFLTNEVPDRAINALKEARISIFKADVLRSIAFLIIAFISLVLYKTKTISNTTLVYILGLFIVIDLWGIDKRYLNNDKQKGAYIHWDKSKGKEFAFAPTKSQLTLLERELMLGDEHPGLHEKIEEELALAKEKKREEGFSRLSIDEENDIKFKTLNFNSNFRVLNIGVSPFNDASTSYFFKSIGGYHGAKLKSYQEMIEFEIQPEMQELVGRLQNGVPPHVAFENMNALNMLNTKYLIYNPNSDPVENPNALGSAWFVNSIKWVSSSDEEILSVKNNNPSEVAIINERYSSLFTGINPTSNLERSIILKDYKPNKLLYESDSRNSELAVFSEIYYPKGWIATVDGKEAEIIRINYILRGLIVPSGNHEVVFTFDPPGIATTNVVSLISSSLLLLFGLWVLGKMFKGNIRSRME